MKVGDLVRSKEGFGFKNVGQLGIVTGQSFNGWWDILWVNGRRGAVMRDAVEVIDENR